MRAGEPGRDGAEQDRQEGRGLDERVAGGQLLAPQVVGQDAVLDRAEQGRDRPEQTRAPRTARGTECSRKPSTAVPAAKISANFSRRAISALS